MARLDVESATKQIQEIAEDLHPMYNKFIGREVCNKRKIFTSGTSTHDSSGSRKKIRPLGFANYPHFDRRDKIHSKAVEYFENTFRKRMEGKQFKDKDRRVASRMLKNVREVTGGYGVPTTCGYQVFEGDRAGSVKGLHSRFGLFDFSMDLKDKQVHHFFGWAFAHVTLVPFRQHGVDRIQVFNDPNEDDIIVLAWGATGGNAETRAAAQQATEQAEQQFVPPPPDAEGGLVGDVDVAAGEWI